jgi:hypothetical protein
MILNHDTPTSLANRPHVAYTKRCKNIHSSLDSRTGLVNT